ncbi:MAG: radical SAM/SPASM domain-containing protein [Candidatus Aenigmatarchaeota archaeon]
MNKKVEKLKKWKDGGRASPYVMDINPTDLCNLSCKSCWQRSEEFGDFDGSYELTDKKLREVVDQGIEMGIDKFRITGGGEPFMRKDIVLELMERIKNAGKVGTITTNGTLLDEEDLDLIMDINWDIITFSIDGPNKETNDRLRGEGSFSAIKSSLQYLMKSEREGPEVKFNTVISKKNYDKLIEIIELANEFEVEYVSFETMTVHSDTGEKIKLSEEGKKEVVREIPEVKKKAEEYGIGTNVQGLKKKYFDKTNDMTEVLLGKEIGDFTNVACYEPWYHLVLKVDGSAQPCCLYDAKEENVKKKSLEEIWFGDFFQGIRKNIKKGNFSNYCEICNASQVMANEELSEKLQKL